MVGVASCRGRVDNTNWIWFKLTQSYFLYNTVSILHVKGGHCVGDWVWFTSPPL